MAPKSFKKITRRSTEDRYLRRNHSHHRYWRIQASSPVTKSLSLIVARNKSISTCCQQFKELISKMSLITGPNHRCDWGLNTSKQEIEEEDEINKTDSVLLPPLNPNKKGTVFLDLDETLVHSSFGSAPPLYDFVIKPNINGQTMTFYVLKRPGVDRFLDEISKKYELVVFTASLKEYAEMVLGQLDPKGVLLSHCLYRDSCSEMRCKFVKDLSRVGRDLSKVVIVDDNPHSYYLQPENGIPVRPFTCDFSDRELRKLMGFFEACDLYEDMRDAVNHYLGGEMNSA